MAGLSNGVNLSPQHHERFESFTFYSGSGAAKDYLPSLIHFALDFDFLQNTTPLSSTLL